MLCRNSTSSGVFTAVPDGQTGHLLGERPPLAGDLITEQPPHLQHDPGVPAPTAVSANWRRYRLCALDEDEPQLGHATATGRV